MSFPFNVWRRGGRMKCKECGLAPETTLSHSGLCTYCLAHYFEDCV